MAVEMRFELAQAWWVASEIVRRHPEFTVRGDDHLTYLSIVHRRSGDTIAMVNPGTVHVLASTTGEAARPFSGPGGAISATSARSFIERVEGAMGLPSPQRAAESQAHTLAFRLISSDLMAQVNDNHDWDCRSEVATEDFALFHRDWISTFPGAAEAVDRVTLEEWDVGIRERHFWGLTRAEQPIALVSVEGILYRPHGHFDLVTEYQNAGRRLTPVLARTLRGLLI